MSVTRVFDLLQLNQDKFSKSDILAAKEQGSWRTYSTEEFVKNVDLVSLGLLASGISKEDKIANMSPNRPEWNFIDFGIMQTGAVHVPMYPTLSEADMRFILNDAGIKMIFVANRELYDKINKIWPEVPSLQVIFSYDRIDGVPHWSEVMERGKTGDVDQLATCKQQVKPDDLLTLIYTSGTTGNPKGVMLTHNNLVSNFTASTPLVPVDTNARALSFLPLSHIFERMVCYLYLSKGISIYYAESLETIGDNLKEVKPHIFTTVPRLLEKVYDKIVGKGSELTGIKKKLFFWALHLGLKYELNRVNGAWYEFQLKLANKIIFKKWREALGGNIVAVVSGGAALQPRLARVFWAGKIPVLEGYGLTETSPVIAVNNLLPGNVKFGTVGPVIEGVTVKIAEDGEILCKGPNVMVGYYKHPELTAESIDANGWFHTGDIGTIEDEKFLRITDRKKEIFKTAGGKYVAPQILENKFKESILIEQILVIGENRRFPAALIVPAFAALKDWCAKKGIQYTTNEDVIKNPQVIDKFQREIEKYNADFGKWEQVKKFELLPHEWSIDKGEMTPKLSLKRKVILEKYNNLVENIYRDSEHI